MFFFYNLLIAFIIATFLAFFILIFSYLSSLHKPDFEKNSAYECGFLPFSDTRFPFEIHFYLVSILFIIFDIEILFLFPWSVSLYYINYFGFFSMLFFLIILILGFLYEWQKGA